MSACPSSVCTMRRSAPFAKRWLAKAWRSTWGLTRSPRKPAATARSFNSRAACWRVKWPAVAERGEQPFRPFAVAAFRDGRQIGPHCRLGGAVERHQALLAALAAHHQHLALMAGCRCRQRHQFGDAQPRRIKEFEEAQQALRPQPLRRRPVGHFGGRARRRDEPVNLGDREHLGQASGRAWGRSMMAAGSSRRCPSA